MELPSKDSTAHGEGGHVPWTCVMCSSLGLHPSVPVTLSQQGHVGVRVLTQLLWGHGIPSGSWGSADWLTAQELGLVHIKCSLVTWAGGGGCWAAQANPPRGEKKHTPPARPLGGMGVPWGSQPPTNKPLWDTLPWQGTDSLRMSPAHGGL